jgi:fatty acid desaturase
METVTTTTTTAVMPLLRRQALEQGLLEPGGWRSLLHFAALIASWAALVSVGFAADSLFVWIPIWICVAFIIVGFGAVAHDCVHGTVVKSNLGNSIVGHLAFLGIGLPFTDYRQYHLLHHADTLGKDDPEGPGQDFKSKAQYALFHVALGPGFIAFIWLSALGGALHKPPKWARTDVSQRVLRHGWFPGILGPIGLAYASARSEAFRHVWLFPWLFVLVPVLAFVLCGEHYAGRVEDGTLKNSYTPISNRVMRFAIFNVNNHTAHHLLPRVPGPSLPKMTEIASPYLENTHRGYLAFHRGVLTGLPWFAPREESSAAASRLRALNAGSLATTSDVPSEPA